MDSYAYAPLPDHKDSIRLLLLFPVLHEETEQLRCDLVNSRLSDLDIPFSALAYTEGEVHQTHSLNVNGHEIEIGRKLHTALFDLRRKDQAIHLWVDALCINHDDISEKHRYVQNLWRIYSTAKETIIYLGEDDRSNTFRSAWNFLERNSTWAINADGEIDFKLPSVREDEIHFRGNLDDVEIAVLSQPWFRRCWAFQEAVVPGNLSVQCGRRKISWDDFAKIVLKTPPQQSQYRFRNQQWLKKIEDIQRIQHARSIYHASQGSPQSKTSGLDILDSLARSRTIEISDARDNIFSMIGLISRDDVDGDEFVIDYSKSWPEVYTDFAKWYIEITGSYDILSYVGNKFNDEDTKLFENIQQAYDLMPEPIQMPSWTPIWWKGFGCDRMPMLSFDPRPKNDSLAERSQSSRTAALPGQSSIREISSVNYKLQRLIILDPSNEDEILKSTRKRLVRQNHRFSNDNSHSLACNGTILGTIDVLSPQLFLNSRNEDKFQSLRDKHSDDRKACYNAIMQEWQETLSIRNCAFDNKNPIPIYLHCESTAKFSAAFESLRQPDIPKKGSVEYFLFERAYKSSEGSLDETSVRTSVIDRESFVDGKRLAVYFKPSLAPELDYEESEYETETDGDNIPEKALALVPVGAQPGDFIAHFTGARVAFIVRELENPPDISTLDMRERFDMDVDEKTEVVCCEIVGECLVEGLPELEVEMEGLLDEEWEIVSRPERSCPKCVFVVT